MTIKDLKEMLNTFNESMEVAVSLKYVDQIQSLETICYGNPNYPNRIVLCGEEELDV